MLTKVSRRGHDFDLVAYPGQMVVVGRRRGAPRGEDLAGLTAGAAAHVHGRTRTLAESAVREAGVHQDLLGGRVVIRPEKGRRLTFRWLGRRKVDVEDLLMAAFPGKVELLPAAVGARAARGLLVAAAAVALAVGTFSAGRAVFAPASPLFADAAPTVTIPPGEQAARAALVPVCPGWIDFINNLPASRRPDPVALRQQVERVREPLAAAAAQEPSYVPANEHLPTVSELAGRTSEQMARESVSRIEFALAPVTAACERALGL